MKKKLLFSLIILSAYASQAQKTQAGVVASYNVDKIDGEGMSLALQSGYSVGVYAEKPFGKTWSFQPEVRFEQFNGMAGNSFKDVYPESAYVYLNQNVSLYYLSVPLLVNYRLSSSWKVNLGPEYDVLLSRTENLSADNKPSFKNADLRIVAGVQLQAASSLRLYGRYSYGATNISNINKYHRWNSENIELGIGWRFF